MTSAREGSIRASEFFVLRTPLLPFDEFERWSSDLEAPRSGYSEAAIEKDVRELRARLVKIVSRPEVREAIFIASPDLDDRVADWVEQPDSESGQKVERALVRYFTRMCTRATPFGLFAGFSLGRLSDHTDLATSARSDYVRHTRLDMDYLSALSEALSADINVASRLRYRPNSSLYRNAGRVRYAESRMKGNTRHHHLVAVEETDYLLDTLERATSGATPNELAEALVDEEITIDEALEYIHELIENQLLVSPLTLPVTGSDPLTVLTNELLEIEAGQFTGRMADARSALEKLDSGGLGASIESYKEIAEYLDELPAEVELRRLFQVDMSKPAPVATLGQEPIHELIRGMQVLLGIFGARRDPLESFREAFVERYEMRSVPLTEVLDEESGIGFDTSGAASAANSPLLEGLVFPPGEPDDDRWATRHNLMLRKLEEAWRHGSHEWSLTPEDLRDLEHPRHYDLPNAFQVMATLLASSQAEMEKGDFRLVFSGAEGPSGARLMGRLCYAEDELTQKVRQHVKDEESFEPDAIFAEIAHLPEGRMGNVLLRPVLRDFEIPFLARSGVDETHQIPISDLDVSVESGRVVLRSRGLGKEVVPRLSSAHNYTYKSLGVYRFLCALQSQHVTGGLIWDWGPLNNADFLPRVRSGRLVFCRARWLVRDSELKGLGTHSDGALMAKIAEWRSTRSIPRRVLLTESDNELLVDFDNALCVKSFMAAVKGKAVVTLTEFDDRLCATGPEGRFAHELLVPFVRTPQPRRLHSKPSIADRSVARSNPPGGEWLYAKLYTGSSTADMVLREMVAPLVEQVSVPWFFVRFGDPAHHLRLRFNANQEVLRNQVWPRFRELVEPLLNDGRVWRLQLDTYEREIERYGGATALLHVEEMFHFDSEAVLHIVEMLHGDEGSDARWRLALKGMDMILEDLGFDLDAKRDTVRMLRDSFAAEFHSDADFRKQIGERYRSMRESIETLLDGPYDGSSELAPGIDALVHRRSAWERSASSLVDLHAENRLTEPLKNIAGSLMHMHANRLLHSAQRAQELVLYSFLDKFYLSRASRQPR